MGSLCLVVGGAAKLLFIAAARCCVPTSDALGFQFLYQRLLLLLACLLFFLE